MESATLLPSLSLLLLVTSFQLITPSTPLPSPYLSPSLFFPNYQTMLQTFKIFIYPPHQELTTSSSFTESLFHTCLLNSPFITTNPNEAHLFYLHFPPNSSSKSISHTIKNLQVDFPFWNRTLGADHFYLSCSGISYESDRNLVELKKNAIQISCFPSSVDVTDGRFRFIPHKDITLPEASERKDDVISSSKFCLFYYNNHNGSVSGIGEALRDGCVPVVISESGMVDLPFVDVLRWTEFAVFAERRGRVEEEELKKVVSSTCGGEKYEKLREAGRTVSKHFVWNSRPQPYDAFHTVLYQLWRRRHIIRYSRREL